MTILPARERNRFGLRSFLAPHPPEPAEALLDKVAIAARGSVRARSEEELTNFVALIGSTPTAYAESTPRLFRTGSWRGNQWTARRAAGSTIGGGELQFHRNRQRRDEAGISLTLSINPIRTLAHLLDRHRFGNIPELDPLEFFRETPNPTAARRTLDRQDNMVADFLSFAGSVHTEMLQRVATYLAAYERALMQRVTVELCPPEQGFTYADDHGAVVAANGDVELRLEWSALSLSQCEVCWERHDTDALAKVHALAEQVIASAREGEVRTYPDLIGADVERALGALSVRLPLVQTGKIILVVYAKAVDRLRIEVRYLSDIPQEVRDRLTGEHLRLTDWFRAIRRDAAPRVPWAALQALLVVPAEPTFDALLDLVDAVADVTDRCKNKRRGLLHQLLRHGALTATNRNGDAPSTVLQRLQDRGVLEHVRLVRRDAEIGRRYRLAARYAGLVGRITSPNDS